MYPTFNMETGGLFSHSSSGVPAFVEYDAFPLVRRKPVLGYPVKDYGSRVLEYHYAFPATCSRGLSTTIPPQRQSSAQFASSLGWASGVGL